MWTLSLTRVSPFTPHIAVATHLSCAQDPDWRKYSVETTSLWLVRVVLVATDGEVNLVASALSCKGFMLGHNGTTPSGARLTRLVEDTRRGRGIFGMKATGEVSRVLF